MGVGSGVASGLLVVRGDDSGDLAQPLFVFGGFLVVGAVLLYVPFGYLSGCAA